MSDLDTLFADMAGASGSSSGVFFTQGNYDVTLKSIEYIPNGHKGRSVKFHFNVDASNNVTDAPVGATRSWILKLDKSRDQNRRTLSDIKNLIFALLGQDPVALKDPAAHPKAHEQASKIFKAVCDAPYAAESGIPQTMLFGRKCKLEAQKVPMPATATRAAGEYTRHIWAPLAAPATALAA